MVLRWVVVENLYGTNPAKKKALVLSHFFSLIKLLLIQGCHFDLRQHDSWLLFLVRSNCLMALAPSCIHPTCSHSALPCLFGILFISKKLYRWHVVFDCIEQLTGLSSLIYLKVLWVPLLIAVVNL